MAPTCTYTNCNARCHQAYNDLPTTQTHHAKTCGRTITLKCPQHGPGIVEIIIPPPLVYELPYHPSAASKLCSVCKNHIRSRYADLAYHYADPSCDVCHLTTTCSCFVNPRANTRARILSYSNLVMPSTFFTNSKCADNLHVPPSLVDARNSKEKCAKCLNVCTKGLHQKCSTGPKA